MILTGQYKTCIMMKKQIGNKVDCQHSKTRSRHMNCQKNKTKQNKDFDGTYNAKHANVQGVNPSLKATK